MIIPIKCFTCGKVLADKYLYYTQRVNEIKTSRGLDKNAEPKPGDMSLTEICPFINRVVPHISMATRRNQKTRKGQRRQRQSLRQKLRHHPLIPPLTCRARPGSGSDVFAHLFVCMHDCVNL